LTVLFIGVVSHPASRFAESTGADGLAQQIASGMRAAGIDTTVEVNALNAYDPSVLPIDGRVIARSLHEQLRVEHQWRVFLQQGTRPMAGLREFGSHAVRRFREWRRFIRPWHSADRDSPGSRLIRRLVNIELSHFGLMRQSVAAESQWTLILEDDAASEQLDDCIKGLIGLMNNGPRQPSYVNVSQSFSIAELGIDHLMSQAPSAWQGAQSREVLSSNRPVTNTVCAILYRTSFVGQMLAVVETMPLDPVIPIDWKINIALMRMFESGELIAGDCWTVSPAPIDQLSMIPQR